MICLIFYVRHSTFKRLQKETVRVFRKNYKFNSDELAGDDIDVVYTNDGGFKFQFLFNFQFELEPGKPEGYRTEDLEDSEDPYRIGSFNFWYLKEKLIKKYFIRTFLRKILIPELVLEGQVDMKKSGQIKV